MIRLGCLLVLGFSFFMVSCERDDQPSDNDAWVVRHLTENGWDDVSLDMFFIDTAFVDGDSLRFSISHSGGCKVHLYKLWQLPDQEGIPITLLLEHEANGDLCEAMVYVDLAFSLKPLRIDDADSINFLLRGTPIMSSYYGDFTYRW